MREDSMFRAVLASQWRWCRVPLLLGAIAGFAIPILSVQRAGDPSVTSAGARLLLDSVQTWSVGYPLLAAALAVAAALCTWGADHRGRHVYALSLPIPRWRYALLRLGAGAVLLLIPVVAVWVGALAAATTAHLPAGLSAYPDALAIRFALALMAGYAVMFAIAAGTARSAGLVLGTLGALLVLQLALSAAGSRRDILLPVVNGVLGDRGPLGVFAGRWMLIDV
jgi:hypothetical protein